MRDLPDILNWRRLDDRITLSGQPTEEQLAEIRDLGVTHVINLGPHHNKGALADEAGTIVTLGMEYIYIPVEFGNPTDEDFAKFCDAIESCPNTQIHVHCIYNARVTAFFYRYAKTGQGISEAEAHTLMDGIWKPGNDWAKFIGSQEAVGQPNRYAGEDY
ncbi:protein tyrosine phosphatase family protein [Pelagibius sp. Alg239-R121]|uniref:protein tyrosine phosphatase family protein n=1 Tax=Pelagibius sp. Alg239-R121 TaxID=2993448 RepID=UPI0024A6A6AC|nr:protein tyrosine phosphatase family protein [Pelagibius sp. Alg239-R121]